MKRGFTLIELLLSAGLFLSLTAGMVFSLGQGLRVWKKAAVKIERQQIACLLMERVCRDLRAAGGILSGSSSEEVVLEMGSETIGYKLVDRKVRRKTSRSTAYLTSEGEIGELAFSYPSPKVVRVVIDGLSSLVWVRN